MPYFDGMDRHIYLWLYFEPQLEHGPLPTAYYMSP